MHFGNKLLSKIAAYTKAAYSLLILLNLFILFNDIPVKIVNRSSQFHCHRLALFAEILSGQINISPIILRC